MILPVRPHYIFDQVKGDRSITIPIPGREPGSPTLLETFLLMAIGKIVLSCRPGNGAIHPAEIFEIGTFAGSTTANLAANFPQAQITTLDIDASRAREKLRQFDNVKQVQAHSMAFDFRAGFQKFSLVFVDGGHDLTTMESDTENAFRMILPPSNQAAIVWHDFGHPAYPGVAQCLTARPEPIYHVEDSQMAVYFRN